MPQWSPHRRTILAIGWSVRDQAAWAAAAHRDGLSVRSAELAETIARIDPSNLAAVLLGSAHPDCLGIERSTSSVAIHCPRVLIGVFSPLHAAPNTTLFAISLPGSDDWPGSATAAIDQLRARSVAARLLGQLPAVSGEQRELLKAALTDAHYPLTVEALARRRRLHERTLRKHCQRVGLPSPQWVCGWARLLVAAYYLDDPRSTVEAVADRLGFSSPSNFRRQCLSYLKCSPSRLRDEGAERYALVGFSEAVLRLRAG